MFVIGGFSRGEHLNTLQIYDGEAGWVLSEVSGDSQCTECRVSESIHGHTDT